MKKIIVVCLVVMLVFAAGAFASETGVLDSVFGNMRNSVRGNTDQLISSMNGNITTQVEDALGDVIVYQTDRANTAIETYYNESIEGLGTHPDIVNAGNEISSMTNVLIEEEKTRIDDAISEALGN